MSSRAGRAPTVASAAGGVGSAGWPLRYERYARAAIRLTPRKTTPAIKIVRRELGWRRWGGKEAMRVRA